MNRSKWNEEKKAEVRQTIDEMTHYGCAYCGNPRTYVDRIERELKSADEIIALVVTCEACRREDWIGMHSNRLARIAVLL